MRLGVRETHATTAQAIAGYLEKNLQKTRRKRQFFRLEGFDNNTYRSLIAIIEARAARFGTVELVLRTMADLDEITRYTIAATHSPTWYRNNLDKDQALVLILNRRTTDEQSLKDIYQINEATLSKEGLDHVIAASFQRYQLAEDDKQQIVEFVKYVRKRLFEPQLRDLVAFLMQLDHEMSSSSTPTIAAAIARSLPYLGMFRCNDLKDKLTSAQRDKLLRTVHSASRIGQEIPADKDRQKYLEQLAKVRETGAFADDTPFGGPSADRKADLLEQFIVSTVSEFDTLLEIFSIDWREAALVLSKQTKVSSEEKLKSLADQVAAHLDLADLDANFRSMIDALQEGKRPDTDLLEQFIRDYSDALERKTVNALKRLIDTRTFRTNDFIVGVVTLALRLLLPEQGDGSIRSGLQIVVSFSAKDNEKLSEAAVAAFRVLYGGIEQVLPSVTWEINTLWAEAPDAEDVEAEEASDQVSQHTIEFQVQLRVGGKVERRAPLVWLYRADDTAAATVANLVAERNRITEHTDGDLRLTIPIYNTCSELNDLRDLNLRRPRRSLGNWYRDPRNLRAQLEEQLKPIASKSWAEIDTLLLSLEQQWATVVREAVEIGLCHAVQELTPLLLTYEQLFEQAADHWTQDRAAQRGYRILCKAWIVGPEHFNHWAIVPLLHPLKLLWWRERTCKFNAIIEQLLNPAYDVLVVDDRRFERELPSLYGSATFPAVLALPDQTNKSSYFLPVEEADGYELYCHQRQGFNAHGQEAEELAFDEIEAEAKRASASLTAVIQDYIETYPFVQDGLEIYLFRCGDGTLPLQLVEDLLAMAKRADWGLRLSVVVHTEDQGTSLFQRVSAWTADEHEQADPLEQEYFPPVTLKVLECSTDELLQRIEDTDLIILFDVLSEQGQKVEAQSEDAVEEDMPCEGYLPLDQSQQKPFERGSLRRSVRLNPLPQPRLLRLFYNAQFAAANEKNVPASKRAVFHRELTLTDWEATLAKIHKSFNWVVCYDPTIDRFLLEETLGQPAAGAVQVIRYAMGLGRKRQYSLTVSASGGAQRVVARRLKTQLHTLIPTAPDAYCQQVAEQLIEHAKILSGDIVLRAAGPGTFLNELIGLVLAKVETERAYCQQHPDALFAWIFLDDFAHWFTGKLPDLLFVGLRHDQHHRLLVEAQVIEAKCVSKGVFDQESKDAKRQVAIGLDRMEKAFSPTQAYLDSLYWHDQFYRAVVGNFMLDEEQYETWDAFEYDFRQCNYAFAITGHSRVYCYEGEVNDEGTNPQSLSASDINGTVDKFVHRTGRRGLLTVLADLVRSGDNGNELMALYTPPVDEPQEEPSRSEILPVNQVQQSLIFTDGVATGAPAHETPLTATSTPVLQTTPPNHEELAPPSKTATPVVLQPTPAPVVDPDWLQGKARELERALRQYKIDVANIDAAAADIGPSVVRYKVRLRPGETIARFQRIADDLARELALPGPPFIDNIPGTHFVGVDLPRPTPEVVELLPLLAQLGQPEPGVLPIIIGRSPDGKTVIEDMSEFPHLLVAGATNSGKSVFLRSLLLCLLEQYRPGDIELVIVDPKQTDFSFFDGLPQLRGGQVIRDRNAAKDVLLELVQTEMPRRQKLMAGRSLKIKDFNRRFPNEALPPIIAMIDEYAQLTATLSKKDAEAFEQDLMSLAAVARSTGIHLVLATQRPSADVVTSTLKANLDARIAFRVASAVNSRIVLDQGGAENLLGRGDMLFRSPSGQVQRLQGAYIDEVAIQTYLARF